MLITMICLAICCPDVTQEDPAVELALADMRAGLEALEEAYANSDFYFERSRYRASDHSGADFRLRARTAGKFEREGGKFLFEQKVLSGSEVLTEDVTEVCLDDGEDLWYLREDPKTDEYYLRLREKAKVDADWEFPWVRAPYSTDHLRVVDRVFEKPCRVISLTTSEVDGEERVEIITEVIPKDKSLFDDRFDLPTNRYVFLPEVSWALVEYERLSNPPNTDRISRSLSKIGYTDLKDGEPPIIQSLTVEHSTKDITKDEAWVLMGREEVLFRDVDLNPSGGTSFEISNFISFRGRGSGISSAKLILILSGVLFLLMWVVLLRGVKRGRSTLN